MQALTKPDARRPPAYSIVPDSSRRLSTALAAIALAAAMLLGGSGSMVPAPEIVLECLLAALAVVWLWLCPDALRHVPRSAWTIAALLLAVPLYQLLPLPPLLWHSLPGRSVEQQALDLVGQGASWRPLSLTANRTVASLLAMAAAAAVLVMTAAQDRRGRTVLLATMAAVALLSVVVGAMQLSGGADNSLRFYNPAEAFLDGFQTSHNAEADVLLIGMIALAAVAAAIVDRPGLTPQLVLGTVCGATLLLILGVVLTASRIGIALLPMALTAQLLVLRQWLRLRLDKRLTVLAVLAVLGLVGTAMMAGRHGALSMVWNRFHATTEFRPEIWRDAWFALRQYWPWGAGMGSFIPVFAAAERLGVVTGKYVNRAHDDYLEFLIETGLPGVLAFGFICRQILINAWHGWRSRMAGASAQLLCGAANLLILALHSLGDYPLRTLSIACMTAVSAGLLLPIARWTAPGPNGNEI